MSCGCHFDQTIHANTNAEKAPHCKGHGSYQWQQSSPSREMHNAMQQKLLLKDYIYQIE